MQTRALQRSLWTQNRNFTRWHRSFLDDKNNYTPLTTPMVEETARKTRAIIDDLHQGNHIGTMTKKWLLQTPNPPRIPVFYTLTKVHKATLPGRPIISGCDGPTEHILSFLDHILQPIAQAQKSYLKDTTQFINFIEKEDSSKKFDSSLNGCQQLVHQYSSRGRN